MRLFYPVSLLILGSVVMSGCQMLPEDRPHTIKPQICPAIYKPVCAEKGRKQANFVNACEARAAGYHRIREGQCSFPTPSTPLPPERPQQKPCTRDYRPVCGVNGHAHQTFANACTAENAGYRIVAQGECR